MSVSFSLVNTTMLGRPRPGPKRFTLHNGRMSLLLAVGTALWILAIAVATIRMIGATVGLSLTNSSVPRSVPPDLASAGAVTIGLCMATSIIMRVIRPRGAWPALIATAAVIVTTVAAVTGTLLAFMTSVTISCLLWLGGELLLALLPHRPSAAPVRVPLAAGLGTALFGLIWLVLAVIQRLDAATVLTTTGLTLAALTLAVRKLTGEWPVVSPRLDGGPPSWYETILLSFSVGLITFALLGAFVPENVSDATRQHLPIAREFWQSHGALLLDSMPVSRQAIQNHVIFAVAYGFGGVATVKLIQAVIGLASIAGVGALGWMLHGRFAAIVAASVFGTMPIVLWELGHAFIDMLPVLLTMSALACVVIWHRQNSLPWLVVAGGLLGIGVSTKLNMAALLVALAAAVFLVGRAPWSFRDRLISTQAFCLGTLTMAPWLIHIAMSTGTLPGLAALLSRVSQLTAQFQPQEVVVAPVPEARDVAEAVAAESTGPPADWVPFGHAPLDLVRLPWTLTFSGERFAFPVVGRGELGVAAMLITPLSLLGVRCRLGTLMILVALISYVGWWLTPYQISRHLLPTLAIISALGGSGVATLVGLQLVSRWYKVLTSAILGALLATVALTPLFFVTGTRTQMPIALLTGSLTADAYVQDTVDAATPLLASSKLLAPDTPVAFLGGMWDAPQIYTEARLVFFNGNDAGSTPDAVLAKLGEQGIRYIIWNRGTSPTRDSSSTVRSTPFLRQYTRILAGDNNAYLFEVLPAGDTTWGAPGVSNLLLDPGLKAVKGKRGHWSTDGKSIVADGVVALSRRATLSQEVDVTAGHAYLLQAPIRCLDASGRGILTLHWLDSGGSVIGTASEEVSPGQQVNDQFLWRRAPDGAASVRVEFSMAGPSRCEFSGAALYDLG